MKVLLCEVAGPLKGQHCYFCKTSPPISHAGHRPGKCYLFLHELTAGEILTFTVCAVVVFGGQAGGQCACVVLLAHGGRAGGWVSSPALSLFLSPALGVPPALDLYLGIKVDPQAVRK